MPNDIKLRLTWLEHDQASGAVTVVHSDYAETLELAGGGTREVDDRKSAAYVDFRAAFMATYPSAGDPTDFIDKCMAVMRGLIAAG